MTGDAEVRERGEHHLDHLPRCLAAGVHPRDGLALDEVLGHEPIDHRVDIDPWPDRVVHLLSQRLVVGHVDTKAPTGATGSTATTAGTARRP
ncbi:MAG: hypothetical protein WCA29_03840 [Jiangellales bacterium]